MSDLNSRQQQLRQLMQEKARSKKTDSRIESPLAKYDEQNNLWCIVCNQKINSELIWETHLIGKSHKTVIIADLYHCLIIKSIIYFPKEIARFKNEKKRIINKNFEKEFRSSC